MILFLKTLRLCSKSFRSLFVYPNQWAWLNSHGYPTLNQNYNLVLKSLRNRPTKKWPWWGFDVLANDAPYSERDDFFYELTGQTSSKKRSTTSILKIFGATVVCNWFHKIYVFSFKINCHLIHIKKRNSYLKELAC